MRAPACNSRHGEERGIQRVGQVKHRIYEAGIEVYVGIDGLVNVFLLANQFGSGFGNGVVKLEFFFQTLFFGKLACVYFKNFGSRVGYRINGVPYAVNKPCTVKRLLCKYFPYVIVNVALCAFFDVFLYVFKHMHNFYIRTAVFGTFQRP